MFKIICISNRKLCKEDFLKRVEKIAAAKPDGFVLREKDLSAEEYQALAQEVLGICNKQKVPCILHTWAAVSEKLGASAIHLPMPDLRCLGRKGSLKSFEAVGASCHSLSEALEAEAMGATVITASPIFPTDCKKNVPPKGLAFLSEICQRVSIPVIALGGISESNIAFLPDTGAAGAAVMSAAMTCEDPNRMIKALRKQVHR